MTASLINAFDIRILSPEIFVLSMSCVVLLVGLFSDRLTYGLAQFTLLGAGILTYWNFNCSHTLFDGMYHQDAFAALLKLFIYVLVALVFFYSRLPTVVTSECEDRSLEPVQNNDYYSLALFSVLGAMLLISSTHFMSFFLGLEILSLPLYTMVALDRRSALAAEGSIKYFVTGAVASALLLYGFSMIYGATQSLSFFEVSQKILALQGSVDFILTAGLVFTLAGILFKLGATPFHMWVPDVYEGSATKVTLFVASIPKIAALAIVIRLLSEAFPYLHDPVQTILISISVASMLLGNLVAIVQVNFKRMLAYSSIAHIGYMLLGLIAADSPGYSAAIFYVLIYGLMVAAALAILLFLNREGMAVENIKDLQGLNTRNPWLAFMMLLTMFSMAGIPPLAGFFAKLGVLEALVSAHLVWLAALALVFAIIGVYYYIAVVKVMYFEDPLPRATSIHLTPGMMVVISLNGLALLSIGIFPDALVSLCRSTFNI